ncbi:pentapeptide repeat-containing protein [Streptomyces sp. NPDC008125]|uniref:pentapeptide repeat-containing protein n=1 Tax=Streptomyces sp. NPDC008125 TaxID=3364811 RepID=UPI0036EC01EC
MSVPPADSLPIPPPWPCCGHGALPGNPVGCRGVQVTGHTACLAHLAPAERSAHLAGLAPGAAVDHRGTRFADWLLRELLDVLTEPGTEAPRIGTALFDGATFLGDARFLDTTFEGTTSFERATFEGVARFDRATFKGRGGFEEARFRDHATFMGARFEEEAEFRRATFSDDAEFGRVAFGRNAWFHTTTFSGYAGFTDAAFAGLAAFLGATFAGDVLFHGATCWELASFRRTTFRHRAGFEAASFGTVDFAEAVFTTAAVVGPLVCTGGVVLSGAVFAAPVTLSMAARNLECRRTRWASTAELRLRYASVDFADAVFEYPLTIAAEAEPFVFTDGQVVEEHTLTGAPDAAVRLTSLRGVDAAHLVLAGVNLADCVLTGAVHLDQVRLEGACSFGDVPSGTNWRHGLPVRFTRRRTLAEERSWRARQPRAAPGWGTEMPGARKVGPEQLAPVYRALRKAFEDGKNEPGAADFYYGEMEMRRHDRTVSTRPERGLLYLYWLLSGYGLRASRALGWLAVAVFLTIFFLMGFGIPENSAKQEATGTVPPGGGRVVFEIDREAPLNPTGSRYTTERFEKAFNVTANSVVFRSSGQDLTTAGIYIEMGSRLAEPVLLGLAVLAVRNRVKR